MRKIVLQFTTIAIILLLSACSNDEIIEKNDNNPAHQTGRTLSLTATIPGENSDNPTTRVGLEQKEDKSIDLTWEDGDELQLAFVQGETKIKGIARVKNITDGGKKAQFDIVIPDGVTDGSFDLYGVYGGSGLDDADPTKVILPTNPGSPTSLASVKERKDVMLHFASKAIQTASPQASVVFKHLGSLFSITLKNSSSNDINGLNAAALFGADKGWAFNAEGGGETYDLVKGEFMNTEVLGNALLFTPEKNTLPSGESITFWGWYPPLPNIEWPRLSLLLQMQGSFVMSSNTKPARTEPTAAGKSYYFFAAFDGKTLGFTDDSFIIPPLVLYKECYVPTMGTLNKILTEDEKGSIQTLVVTGEINKADFDVMKNDMPNLSSIDLSAVTCQGNMIPESAFGNLSDEIYNITITTITLPESITSIGNYAFKRCVMLTGPLNIPDGVTTIGAGAFSRCGELTGPLTIPNSVTTIGEDAFAHCTGFDGSLSLSTELTIIGKNAFTNCDNLTGSLVIPSKVNTIGDLAFNYCTGFNGTLTLPAGLTTIGEGAFSYCTKLTGSLTIPNNITTIKNSAFKACRSLDGLLTLPTGLTTIEDDAFDDCLSLTGTLNLPATLTTIGKHAFNGCKGFTNSLTIPHNVTIIREWAFNSCTGFTGSLNLPAGLITIENDAFAYCTNLSEPLTIPNNVTTIGDRAFQGCRSIKGSLTLSSTLTTIGERAFDDCEQIDGEVVFPSSLESIGEFGFDRCNKVTVFKFPQITPFIYSTNMLPAGVTLHVPASARAKYKVAEGWKNHTILGYIPAEGGLPNIQK